MPGGLRVFACQLSYLDGEGYLILCAIVSQPLIIVRFDMRPGAGNKLLLRLKKQPQVMAYPGIICLEGLID